MADIELVELHDARLGDVRIGAGGEVFVRFEHVTVYERLPERLAYNVASYSAELVALGATSVGISGTLDPTYKVIQVMKDGEELSTDLTRTMCRGNLAGGVVVFKFIEKCSIELKCSAVSLKLVNRVRTVEVWEGPL